MRRALAVLLGLLLLAVGAVELLGPGIVEQRVAERVQQTSMLEELPEVEVRGRPFLTQAVRGVYDDIVVRSKDVPAGPLRFDSLVTQLTDARVPLHEALTRPVERVPVARVTTRAVIGYDALTAAVDDRRLVVSPADDGLVRVTGSVDVLGQTLRAAAVSRATLDAGSILVTADRFEVGNQTADALLTRALGDRLDFTVELDPLPYGLELRDVDARPDAVVLTASASDTVVS